MENTFNPKISLRPFLESIKKICADMTRENLADFIIYFAETIPAKERVDFLDNIMSFTDLRKIPDFDETIIDQINDLKDEIKERIRSIEDGSYYDVYENDQYDWNYYDENPVYLTEEQKEDMEKYFDAADNLFLAGKLNEAMEVYKELYSFLDNDTDYYGDSEINLDIEHRETRARYCRCIYETSGSGERAGKVLSAININAPLSTHNFEIHENEYPLLIDIINAKMGDLPEEKIFLVHWINLLKEYDTDRANILLLEATFLKEGPGGVKKLAREWKIKQPRGYLFWIHIKKSEEDWTEVVTIAREALHGLPFHKLRGLIAKELIYAGEKLKEKNIILEGKRELFYSLPDENNLITFMEEAIRQNKRTVEIENVLSYFQKYNKKITDLEIKILLMKGDLHQTFVKAHNTDFSEWSYGDRPGAVLFAGILAGLVKDYIQEAIIIKLILKRYSGVREVYNFTDEDDDTGINYFLYNEIMAGLKNVIITDVQKKNYIHWAENTGRNRIENIVSNKYRKSYNKAAEVLCGLAECFYLLGEKKRGLELICEYRDNVYNRYPAFKREVRSVLAKSKIIGK